MANLMKTGVLLAALTVLVVLIGGALGGQNGMVMAFGLAMVMNLGSYWFSDKIVLAMYRAQPVDEASAPALYRIVRTLATRAGMPMPRVYVIPGEAPERVRDRPQPAARGDRRHGRHLAHHERGRAGRGAGPRALPRAEPRHADHGHRGHPGRGDHLHGPHGPVGHDLRRRPARQRRERVGRRPHRRPAHDRAGAPRRHR